MWFLWSPHVQSKKNEKKNTRRRTIWKSYNIMFPLARLKVQILVPSCENGSRYLKKRRLYRHKTLIFHYFSESLPLVQHHSNFGLNWVLFRKTWKDTTICRVTIFNSNNWTTIIQLTTIQLKWLARNTGVSFISTKFFICEWKIFSCCCRCVN